MTETEKAVTPEAFTSDKSGLIPIVFIHQGYSRYLEYTMRQARLSNSKAPVYLFGDEANSHLPGITHVHVEAYEKAAYPFENIYKHYSNKEWYFEMYCLKRYYVLLEIMRAFELEEAFFCDSDVMLYADVALEAERLHLRDYDVAFHIHPAKWLKEVVAHTSYWTFQGLSQFCRFITHLYTKREDVLRKVCAEKSSIGTNIPLVSDNFVLYLFYEENKRKVKILDLTPVRNGIALDLIINDWLMDQRYEMVEDIWFSVKKIYKGKDGYYCYDTVKRQKVKFHTFHFTSSSKAILHRYYQGRDLQYLQWKDELQYTLQQIRKAVRIRTRIQRIVGRFKETKPQLVTSVSSKEVVL